MIQSVEPNAAADCLIVGWEDGGESQFPAAFLRREARDAWTRRELIDTGDVTVAPGLLIEAVEAIGGAAINIRFSDGHDKAIYPFIYLRELSEQLDN